MFITGPFLCCQAILLILSGTHNEQDMGLELGIGTLGFEKLRLLSFYVLKTCML